MSDYIQKKCPRCGAILTIRNQSGLENTTVTCPVCHQTYSFSQMRDVNLNPGAKPQKEEFPPRVFPPGNHGGIPPFPPGGNQQSGGYQQSGDFTEYPKQGGMNNGQTSHDPGTDYTQFHGGINRTPGILIQRQTGMRFPLRMGRNVIGRKSQTSQSTIQLDTGMSRRLSRQHLFVDVTIDRTGNVTHICSLCKPDCNDTFINGARLQFRDKVILRNRMIIRLPDAELEFVLQDPDRTEFVNPHQQYR